MNHKMLLDISKSYLKARQISLYDLLRKGLHRKTRTECITCYTSIDAGFIRIASHPVRNLHKRSISELTMRRSSSVTSENLLQS